MELYCYHCNEPVLTKDQYQIEILGEVRTLCCPGCLAVASTIIASGLVSYYQYRTEFASKYDAIPEALSSLSLYDNADIQQDFVFDEGKYKKITLSLEGLTCSACAWLIEKHLSRQQGVIKIAVNVTTQRALLIWEPTKTSLSFLLSTIYRLGYQAAPFEADKQEALFQHKMQQYLYKLGVAGIASMQVMMLAVALYMDMLSTLEEEYKQLFRLVSLIFATPVLLYSATPFYRNAWNNLKAGVLGMDVPVTLALLLAYFASCYATFTQQGEVYFESVSMFTFFLLLGRYYESKAKYSAITANANLIRLLPKLATLVDGRTLAAKSLIPSMQVRVLPGESIPADGKVISGETSVNESILTGESLPCFKSQNNKVYAGTINIEGNIEIEVTHQYKESLLANIVQLQENALHTKPQLVTITDKVARVFVAAILCIALATWVYWSVYQPSDAFWIVLSVLVATCPCALSLATPTALTCAISAFGHLGLLVRQSHVFETLTKISHVFIDKTGTLTQGNIHIDKISCQATHTKEQVTAIAASLERYSTHPIAQAFDYYQADIDIVDAHNAIGQGVSGVINGKEWRIGKASYALDNHKSDTVINEFSLSADLWLSCNKNKIASFTLTDPLRPHSSYFIYALQQQNIAITMLTGDNEKKAKQVAQLLSIKDYHANLSPKQKMQFIQRNRHEITMMIGDGVNDTPVLSCAHLSVAMGSSSDITKLTTDIVLLNNNLLTLLKAQQLAVFSKKIIKQNFAWALIYNSMVLPLAVAGMLSPYIAVIGMSASSVLVVMNSLRIKKWKASIY